MPSSEPTLSRHAALLRCSLAHQQQQQRQRQQQRQQQQAAPAGRIPCQPLHLPAGLPEGWPPSPPCVCSLACAKAAACQPVLAYPDRSFPPSLLLSPCAVWRVPGLLHAQGPLKAGPPWHRLCDLCLPRVGCADCGCLLTLPAASQPSCVAADQSASNSSAGVQCSCMPARFRLRSERLVWYGR